VQSKLNIVQRQTGDVAVLVLSGQMLLDDGDLAFGQYVDDLVTGGVVKIVLDLGGVTYIDSSGVGMLAGKLKQVRARGGDIRLLNLNSRSQRLLGMMKLMIVFERFEDEAVAVRSFATRPGAV
jgi:anti-anti-sigma factor